MLVTLKTEEYGAFAAVVRKQSSTLRIQARRTSETLKPFYQSTWHHKQNGISLCARGNYYIVFLNVQYTDLVLKRSTQY
jgi:hypothetical protein